MTGVHAVNVACAVIVPCYNEALRLDRVAFEDFLGRHAGRVSLWFVDDGSTDDTLRLLEELAAVPGAHVLPKGKNAGKAEAVRFGMQHAIEHTDALVIGFWDADLATPLPSILDLLGVLDTQPTIDMVFGSRVKLLGRQIERKAVRHYLGRVFATVASNVLGVPIYDTQCGAKLFRRTPQLARILQDPFLSRWIFDVEMLARLIGLRGVDYITQAVYEYPLETWCDIGGSKVKPSDFLKAIGDLLRIWNANLRHKSG
jgi:glycosyltransferase involved in cell wall biosynthesis